jgi:GGDEF domain-containing protein
VAPIDAKIYHTEGDVMHAADQAMYKAKSENSGHSRYRLSEPPA